MSSKIKSINQESDQEMAQALLHLIDLRKEMDKEEKDLKEYFKRIMKGDSTNVLKVGEILFTLTERSTTSIDREKLAEELGVDMAKQFEKKTSYQVLDVKRIFG